MVNDALKGKFNFVFKGMFYKPEKQVNFPSITAFLT